MWLQRWLHFRNRPCYYYGTSSNASSIIKIDGTTIDEAEDLDLFMPMYNLIEYSSNYFERTLSLWFYSKDKAIDFNADIANDRIFQVQG